MKILTTERLLLRDWEENDCLDLYEYASNELVGPNAGWPAHKNHEESQSIIKMFIQSEDTYAIVLKSENKVIGSIGMHKGTPDESLKDLNQREIGYVLNPKYWGNGYIPEAVMCLIKYGFEQMKLDIVWCGHYDFNERSKRVVEKCGFHYRFNRDVTLNLLGAKVVNEWFYSIFKNEYCEN